MINLAKCLEFRDETWRSKQLNQDPDFPEEYLPLQMQRTAFFGKKIHPSGILRAITSLLLLNLNMILSSFLYGNNFPLSSVEPNVSNHSGPTKQSRNCPLVFSVDFFSKFTGLSIYLTNVLVGVLVADENFYKLHFLLLCSFYP